VRLPQAVANFISAGVNNAGKALQDLGAIFNMAKKADVAFADYLAKKYGLDKRSRRRLHDMVTKEGLSNDELEAEAAAFAKELEESRDIKEDNRRNRREH
jgi:hypothetical protein